MPAMDGITSKEQNLSSPYLITKSASFPHYKTDQNVGFTCGYLSKFTNVLRGYQRRYFVLLPDMGTLEYYLPKDKKRIHPRGLMILGGAIVCENHDNKSAFSIILASGEVYKLRAADRNERQMWIERLRQVSKHHEHYNCSTSPHLSSSSTKLAKVIANKETLRQSLMRTRKQLRQLELSLDKCDFSNEDLKALGQVNIEKMLECCSAIYSHNIDQCN